MVAVLSLAGCSAGSLSDDSVETASARPVLSPSVAVALLQTSDLGAGWRALSPANGTKTDRCVVGEEAGGKALFAHGDALLIEGLWVFDTAQHASAHLRDMARGANCPNDAEHSSLAHPSDMSLADSQAFSGRVTSDLPGTPDHSFVILRVGHTVIDVISAVPVRDLEAVARQAARRASLERPAMAH